MMLGLGCLVVLGAALSGCANESGEQAASNVAARFLDAASRGDGEAACMLLTPMVQQDLAVSDGQPCPQSLPMDRLQGRVGRASVWSNWAQVATDKGSVFLTEFEAGWLITAAGCQPDGDAPYHCVVGG
jgi:hypothetical protein